MDEEKVPTIGISYNVELPGKKALVLQSFVERDADIGAINQVLDKLRVAAERQFAFGMIEAARKQLEVEERVAEDHVKRIAVVDENLKRNWATSQRKGDPKLSEREANEQRQAYQNIEESKRRIAAVKKDIAEFQAKVGA